MSSRRRALLPSGILRGVCKVDPLTGVYLLPVLR